MNSGCRGNETGGVRRFRPEWCRAVSELAGGVYQADREILFSGGGLEASTGAKRCQLHLKTEQRRRFYSDGP